MSWQTIKTLISKDFKLFFRDKFFGIMTIVSIVMFIVLYFIMPKTLDETIEIGLYAPHAPDMLKISTGEGALIIRPLKSEDELKKAVIDKELHIGISIPGDIYKSMLSGKKPQLFVYYSSDLPVEMNEMYTILITEMINRLGGLKTGIDVIERVLGPDMGGKQIPHRKRMLPLFVFLMIVMETLGLANLITSELEEGTIEALLTTPMTVIDLFVAKGITGLFLAFSPALLLLIITGSLTQNVLLIIISILLISMMVTGLAFFIASISKDMMSVVAWGTIVIIVLTIPAFSVIFPGPVSGWIKIIPSFFFVNILHRAINFDIGWSGNLNNIVFLTGFIIVFLFLGIISLKRKVQ
jgi:ABC-2 type transport system permease protein